MSALVLYVLLAAGLYYGLGYAKITDPIRSRLPTAVQRWILCPYCSGFWYGGVLAATLGRARDLDFLGLPGTWWATPLVVAPITMITTIAITAVHFRAFQWTADYADPQPTMADVANELARTEQAVSSLDDLVRGRRVVKLPLTAEKSGEIDTDPPRAA